MIDVLGSLGKGAVATTLDVDNALYMTAQTQAVEKPDQSRLIGWGILIEYLARIAIAWLALEVISGDEALFTIGDTKVTPVMVALLIAGLFLFLTNVKDVGDFLVGQEEQTEVKKQPFTRVLLEMSGVNAILSIDTVVSVTSESDELLTVALILSVSSVIRLLFLRQIAGFMRTHPSFKVLTGTFLVLIGLSLILQGVGIDFPEEAFAVGMVIALLLQWAYDKYGSAWFARQLGVTPKDAVESDEVESEHVDDGDEPTDTPSPETVAAGVEEASCAPEPTT